MTTLIKKFFPRERELLQHLTERFLAGTQSAPLKTIIHIGYLNDLLAEPRGRSQSQNIDSYLSWLETKYLAAKENHTGTRVGNPMQTIPDPLVDVILTARFNYTSEEVKTISKQHRLSMIAENLIGNFLEEFLDEKLKETGWVCCYGETLKYSDFCHHENLILQVKNRDNTENSSSSKIRNNNPRIKMWFRTFSQTGRTNWENIYSHLKVQSTDSKNRVNGVEVILNEEQFHEFVKTRVRKNQNIIHNER